MSSASSQPGGTGTDQPALGLVEANWLKPAEQAAWRSFVDASHGLIAALDQALSADAGLSFDEYRILVILSEHQTQRMSDLSRGGLASRSTVSRQVSRLVDRGDVERLPDSTDARNRLVRISDVGRARLHEAAKDHVRLVRKLLFDNMTAEQIDAMTATFTNVQRAVDEVDVR